MYGQILDFKVSINNLLPAVGIDYLHFKGIEVEKGDEWQNLLLNIASQGCQNSFRKLFNHFYPTVRANVIKSGLSKELASELAQETMIRVWNQASSYDPSKGSVSVWIFIIARNLKYDHLRKHRNDPLQATSLDIYSDDHLELIDVDKVESLFDLGLLSTQIHQLPTEQRDIIQKTYFEGMTQQEIAEEGQVPLGTVKSRLRLATATLKKMMGEK